ncbi:hypothetical protein H0H87_003718 [Tephrocybe sp. NHM501043]|nr:hypothetical protein H0H87_003718 [Tephrocybe sp. NHM501043]
MKFTIALALAALAHTASAHYIWHSLVTSSGESSAAIRQPVNNSPVQDVTSGAITCNVSPSAATQTVSVAAGSQVTFKLDNTIYHQGPAAIYLGKAPSTAAAWDGSGANWFKIAEWGATFNPFGFTDFNASELGTTIPAGTPSGDYLLRIEQIGLHVAGAPQWYISCAQITVTGGGSGSPSKVSIPGYVSASDPGLTVNIYDPVPTAYKFLLQTLGLSLLTHSVAAHYIWHELIAGGTTSSAAVRQPINNSPVELGQVSSNDIRCNVSPGAATETVSVAAGSTIGFNLDNTIYHLGPAAIYLGKAPSTAASWDGSGANWFKIAEWGAVFSPSFSFSTLGLSQLTTTIPSNTPAGEYLVRIEQVGLHVAGAPQWYISCAQIKVTGGGSGNPAKVSIPGYVSASGASTLAMRDLVILMQDEKILALPSISITQFRRRTR